MDRLTLKRGGQVLAPSVFTVGNMACGFYALLSAYRGEFSAAATAIMLGMGFDALDGRVARLVHGDSAFGVEFDSLSDFLTFGVAPGYMMYAFILKDYGAWGYPMAFLFALCGALRLARFFNNSPEFWLNLQQMHDLTKAKLALAKTIEAEVRVYQPTAA